MTPDSPDEALANEPLDVRRLAEGLRDAQRDLDAHRGGASPHTSDRRKLARRVDLLSHLLLSHRAAANSDELLDARFDPSVNPAARGDLPGE